MKPLDVVQVVDGRRYSTRTATLLAGDDYWDGHNLERGGTNRFLFRTPRGAYFVQTRTCWIGSQQNDGRLTPVTQADAIGLFESSMRERRVTWEEAFPGVAVEDA